MHTEKNFGPKEFCVVQLRVHYLSGVIIQNMMTFLECFPRKMASWTGSLKYEPWRWNCEVLKT